MSGAEHDYKFGSKNNWRRWLWNRIAERVDRPRDALVLYLAGEQDLDAVEALRRGFSRNNLIAVDRDQSIVRCLRSDGKLAVQADIMDLAWAIERPVGVLLLDFCCGLERTLLDKLEFLLTRLPLSNAVVAANLLRGRDPSSAKVRSILERGLETKHRGEMLSLFMTSGLWCVLTQGATDSEQELEKARDLFFGEIVSIRTSSYKSGPQMFDSFVMQNPMGKLLCSPSEGEKISDDISRLKWNWPWLKRSTRARLAATLAHRTMRMS